ncbi:MAG: hypothetical protein NC218_01360 [Acetobacter sp.]|nr:hypothetical protein [Acetobacter sp.]
MELKPLGAVQPQELNLQQQQQQAGQPQPQVVVVEQVPQAQPQQAVQPAVVPQMFAPTVETGESPKTVDRATEKANEIVSEVFGQAVVHTIATDDEVKKELLDTAKKVVQDKASTIGDKAELESKAQHFLKHEDACGIFGYDEKTTSKFHVKVMAAWVFVLNTIYIFTIGGLIVAPVSFILHKIKVVIKKTWLALILALLVYLLIVVGIPLLTKWLVDLGVRQPDAGEAEQALAMLGAMFR